MPQPLGDAYELIGATTTKTGLKVACMLDERTYEKGIKVSDAEMAALDITGTRSILSGTTRSSPTRRSGYWSNCP
jgi:hypothetical protein